MFPDVGDPAFSQSQLARFREHLAEYGLAEGTIDVYAKHARVASTEGGWVARLRARLAPKTKRLVRAAANHWADAMGDPTLRDRVKKIRLPAARRQAAKTPLTKEQLRQVMHAIQQSRIRNPVRAVLGVMAYRGLRDGDVLRMEKSEILAGLRGGTLAFEAKGERRLEFTVLRTYREWLQILADQPGRWSKVDELLVPVSQSAKSRRAAASRKVQRALAAIGASLGIHGLHPHQLRRTYCVEYLRAHKGDPEALMKLTQHMQWANMTTAMQYVDHVRGKELDAVAETLFDED